MLEEIPSLEELLAKAKAEYTKQFREAPLIAACAPGRVNLIGEHTDYNDGYVLPMALPLVTVVVGGPSGNNMCTVTTLAPVGDEATKVVFELKKNNRNGQSLLTPIDAQWANYVIGVVANFDGNMIGFNMSICTSVPLGGGLSSSASLEVATCTFLEALMKRNLMPKDKALLCQKAEHEYAKMPCGIMDQFISTMGRQDNALLIDCRSLDAMLIPLQSGENVFLIINSNVKHKLTGSEYPQRRAQCQNAATLLGEPSLRSVTLDELKVLENLNVDPVTINRARHVINEIQRTVDAAEALQKGDYVKMGQLMNESHDSLRDLFEVSCAEVDTLVEAARSVEGVMGSRMTGGGFGGCTVTVVKKDKVKDVIKVIKEKYTGQATFYMCSPSHGARLLTL